jgi:glycosyltransferase involved in cell wall biosynthesis
LKICFITEHFPPHIGGVEMMFKAYSSRLVKAGCEVKVLTSNSGGVMGKSIEDGVEIHHFDWRNIFGHPLPKQKDLYPFVQWSDIVHTTTYTAAPAAFAVARKFNKPCVLTVHEALGKRWFWIEENPVKAALFYAFEYYVVKKKYSLYTAVSFATQKDLQALGIKESDIVTIYHGVDKKPAQFDFDNHSNSIFGFDKNTRVFLYYGRPGKTKGVFVLLEAIEKLKDLLPPDVRFIFVLSKEPRNERTKFIKLVAEKNLSNLIKILNPLSEPDLLKALHEAYCVIIPSLTEGFGFTAAEACNLGKPVIASDAGSLPEVVFGKVLSFQNRNSNDLAEKISLALEGKYMMIEPKVFDWDQATKKLLDSYQSLLNKKEDHSLL